MKILKSREELLIHLTSDGTCKCGLRCPFQFEEQFSFYPHVLSLPDNGIPSVIQASCKVGHALRDLMSKPGGAREPRGEKVSTMEGSVSEPKLHRHRSRSRSHRKKPSGKRMPENENEGNGNAIVLTARAVLLSTSEKAEKTLQGKLRVTESNRTLSKQVFLSHRQDHRMQLPRAGRLI